MKLFFESLSTCFRLHVCFFSRFKLLLSPSFQQLLKLSWLTGYYFRVINTSYCIQYGVLLQCAINSCWFCDEKLLLSCCAARDTHFSAFIRVCVCVCVQLIAS